MYLTAFSSAMELLAVSNCLSWLLAVSHCLSIPMELLAVFNCLPWSLAFYQCFFQFPGVAAGLSLSPIVSGCLSISLLVPWSC